MRVCVCVRMCVRDGMFVFVSVTDDASLMNRRSGVADGVTC